MINQGKWSQTIKISWSNLLSYRANFVLTVLGPVIVFFFVKYHLWTSIYAEDQETIIQGYTLKQMISYHVWALIVSLLAKGHTSMNLAEDIRLGRISSYLIYPFQFWEFHTASFIAFQVLQVFVSLISLGVLYSFGIIEHIGLNNFLTGFMMCQFVSLFWFSIQYMTGLLAFWLEETWILRVIFMILSSFLSGAIVPLDFYPTWLVEILNYSPFPYLGYYPIKAFMGADLNYFSGMMILSFWLVIAAWVNHLIWKKGMRLYTAAGM